MHSPPFHFSSPFRVFKSTLHQLACPVDVSCPRSPRSPCVCVGRSSFLLEYPLRVPGIRIPPGAKKGASCFHLKVPGHSAIFPLSFPRVFLSHHRHFRGHEDLFARRARDNNFHVPFVFASRPCSRYPNSRSQAFPSRSFSFNRGRGGTRARCLRHVHLEIPPWGLN